MTGSTRKLAALLGVLLPLFAGTLHAQAPTPTPRAKPRLSGGFGRPRALTPTPSADAPRPAAGVSAAAGEKRARPGEKSGISITNETLVTDPSKGKLTTTTRSPAPPRPPAGAPPSRTVESEVPFAGSSPAPPASAAEEESKWRAAARDARERVETLKLRIVQLEGEEAKLQSDFYAWDDGQYRDGVIKPAWDRKREELEQARRDLAEAERELADLPEKARKAGALPGWLRE